MRNRYIGLMLLLVIPALALAEEKVGPEVGKPAPRFELQDAEAQTYKLDELEGKVTLLIMGNHKLRKHDDQWAEELLQFYAKDNRIGIFIVADMRSVPWFVPRALIRSQLRKNKPPVTLLLDWGGETHQAYRTKADKPNLCLIDPQGTVTYFTRALHSPETMTEVRSHIEAILPDHDEAKEQDSGSQ